MILPMHHFTKQGEVVTRQSQLTADKTDIRLGGLELHMQ